jgi:hypothetical protein
MMKPIISFINYFRGDKTLENHVLIKRFHASEHKG